MSLLRITSAAVLLCAVALPSSAAEPKNDDDKTFYALGVALARNLATFDLTPAELELVKAGMTDGSTGKEKIDLDAYLPKLQELQGQRMAAITQKERQAGQAFIEKAAAEKGATKTASGIVIKQTKAGTGPSPTAKDTV